MAENFLRRIWNEGVVLHGFNESVTQLNSREGVLLRGSNVITQICEFQQEVLKSGGIRSSNLQGLADSAICESHLLYFSWKGLLDDNGGGLVEGWWKRVEDGDGRGIVVKDYPRQF